MTITVYFDGQCPLCVNEVAKWKKAAFEYEVEWLDITDNDELLLSHGIDPRKALLELHTKTDDGRILTSIDSYALLLRNLPRWKYFGWLIGLPVIKQVLKWCYDRITKVRLKREGRWIKECKSCDK